MSSTDATPVAEKPWWQSKTVIGSGVAVLASVAGLVLNRPIDPDTVTQITELVVAAGGIFGGIWAIIGRLTAKTKLT